MCDIVDRVEPAGRDQYEDTLRRTGGEALLKARLSRRVSFDNDRYFLAS